MTKENKTIPIFFATDNNYVPFLCVALQSIIANASKDHTYNFHILTSNLSDKNKTSILDFEQPNCNIFFDNMDNKIAALSDHLLVRDYYTEAIYYRLFIPTMFPQYEKAIYLDCDIAVNCDISKLFAHDLKNNYIAAAVDQAVSVTPEFISYVENYLKLNSRTYINSGVLVMNLNALRSEDFENRFLTMLKQNQSKVAPDQDCLNIICNQRVLFLPESWNKMPIPVNVKTLDEINIVHYNLSFKPWHYENTLYEELFWKHAKNTKYYDALLDTRNSFNTELMQKDKETGEKLKQLAQSFADSAKPSTAKGKAPDRLKVLSKISEYEKNGLFNEDVEDDPPSAPLSPDRVDFLNKKLSNKTKTLFANMIANRFYKKLIRNKKVIIENIIGFENLKNIKSGAIVTCNHCHIFDNYLVYYGMKNHTKRFRLYKVIKESNYALPGKIGFFMRNCNTLTVGQNKMLMTKFLDATSRLLTKNKFILMFPEQSMWWNYKKPRPLKDGAFHLAASFAVPVIPCFITLKDSDITGDDGFPVQKFTLHIAPAIYPDKNKSHVENRKIMKAENVRIWNEIYKATYPQN